MRGSFMHIAVLANATRWDLSPNGLSKYGHLGDGCTELILVEPVSRRDFYRFIKRHAGDKNQVKISFFFYFQNIKKKFLSKLKSLK